MKTKNQFMIDLFNKTYKIGDKLKVEKDNGIIESVTLKHGAYLVGDTPVCIFNEISGCYNLWRVR